MDRQRLDELKIDWLIDDHDYLEDDGQPEDEEDDEAIMNTLRFYVEEDNYDINDPDFEFFFRAYLHNNDYSYPLKSIRRVVDKVRAQRG
jgi:hypothetical protein